MKPRNRTKQLFEGTEEGYRYAITLEVYPTGGFKAKGRIRQWVASVRSMKTKDLGKEQLYKHRVRNKDREWFNLHLGKEYMQGKEVHHVWLENDRCYVLDKVEHREVKHAQSFWS
jgi:hypothetical protein